MIYAISDVAEELSRQYRQKRDQVDKGKKGKLWLKICQDLFDGYGQRSGYSDIHQFKSILRSFQKRGTKNRSEALIIKTISPSVDRPHENRFCPPGEGSTMFTDWQINFFNLNPESY